MQQEVLLLVPTLTHSIFILFNCPRFPRIVLGFYHNPNILGILAVFQTQTQGAECLFYHPTTALCRRCVVEWSPAQQSLHRNSSRGRKGATVLDTACPTIVPPHPLSGIIIPFTPYWEPLLPPTGHYCFPPLENIVPLYPTLGTIILLPWWLQ